MNTVANYISLHHAWKLTLGSAILCAAVTVETGVRGIYDIFQLMAYKGEDAQEKEKIKYNISANLGSALFYGLCAANVIPGSAMLGAAIFATYSCCVTNSQKTIKDEYVLSKMIGQPCHWIAEKVVVPVCEKAIFPAVKAIGDVAYKIITSIPLPKHPIWIASAVLLSAIAVTKFALPLIGLTLI